jgi:acyl-CoA dehydrogenase
MSNEIIFTQEQGMLLDTAMDFCRQHSTMDLIRSRLQDDQSLPTDVWQAIVELGWTGITIPEAHGGLGLGFSELVPVVEAMGRHLMATPLVSSVLVAHALTLAGSDQHKQRWLPQIAGGMIATLALLEPDGSWILEAPAATGEIRGGELHLSGAKCFVQDAHLASLLLVSIVLDGEARLVLLEKSRVPTSALVREIVIDDTRRCFQLCLDGITVPVEQLLPLTCLAELEQAAMLLLCAEMTGGHASVLNLVVEYLKTRKQFDHYIGSYQALKHPTVDILIGLEASRSHLYHAATMIDGDDAQEKDIAVRMAKAVTSEGFAFAGDRAIQFHGGFGFTYECDAQLYLRRALYCQYQFGDARYQRTRLAPLLLDMVV